MKQGTQVELGAWAVTMLLGASLLFAESSAQARIQPPAEWPPTRYEIATQHSLPIPQPEPSVAASPAEIKATELDQRLIANLLVESIIQIESSGNPRKVGSKGERGLMQIMPSTWNEVTRRHFGERIAFNRAFESQLNRSVGQAYLADLQAFLARHRSLWKSDERSLLLACYNAGPERVKQCGFDIRRLPASTRDYVERGSALHDVYLADHNISARQFRLAMENARRSGGV